MSIYGVDISSHNGNIDHRALYDQGIRFEFIKMRQGKYFFDDRYFDNVHGALNAGMLVGSYLYLSYNFLPVDQIPDYLNLLPAGPGYFAPVLDCENWSDANEGGPPRSIEYMGNWIHDAILQIKYASGTYPIVYTYKSFLERLGNRLDQFANVCPLWIAEYEVSSPTYIAKWPVYSFWQYTSTDHLKGVNGNIDVNVWNGDYTHLLKMAGK